MIELSLTVNGAEARAACAPNTLLATFLRENLRLTGTHIGCDTSQCGACTIHLNGEATKACMTPVSTVGRKKITTIEGLAPSPTKLHPVQQAWCELDVAQCGYCQAGQLMTAASLLKDTPKPTDEEIDGAMAGNICRCGTYTRIRAGIKRAAELASGAKEAGQ